MIWQKTILISSFIFFISTIQNQEIKIKNIDGLDVDQFGSIFITVGDKLTRYDKDLKEIASYSQPLLGDITKVDASNALNPVLWFGETYRINILDNRLNESRTINLLDQGFRDPKLISVSDDGNIWIYDQSEDKIIRFSTESNKRTNNSLNISQILGEENDPIQIRSTFEKTYLNVPEKGILIFDAVGAFEKLVALKGIEYFSLYNSKIYYQKENTIYKLDKQGKSEIICKDLTDCKTFDIFDNKIFLVNNSRVEIRAIN